MMEGPEPGASSNGKGAGLLLQVWRSQEGEPEQEGARDPLGRR